MKYDMIRLNILPDLIRLDIPPDLIRLNIPPDLIRLKVGWHGMKSLGEDAIKMPTLP